MVLSIGFVCLHVTAQRGAPCCDLGGRLQRGSGGHEHGVSQAKGVPTKRAALCARVEGSDKFGGAQRCRTWTRPYFLTAHSIGSPSRLTHFRCILRYLDDVDYLVDETN